jgi:hypothetical protein
LVWGSGKGLLRRRSIRRTSGQLTRSGPPWLYAGLAGWQAGPACRRSVPLVDVSALGFFFIYHQFISSCAFSLADFIVFFYTIIDGRWQQRRGQPGKQGHGAAARAGGTGVLLASSVNRTAVVVHV